MSKRAHSRVQKCNNWQQEISSSDELRMKVEAKNATVGNIFQVMPLFIGFERNVTNDNKIWVFFAWSKIMERKWRNNGLIKRGPAPRMILDFKGFLVCTYLCIFPNFAGDWSFIKEMLPLLKVSICSESLKRLM